MELVYFRDTLEEGAEPQYGILMDGDEPCILCLCCGSTVDYGDYSILERLPWQNISEFIKSGKKRKYVVCMNSVYVRDAQFLDTRDLSQDVFDEFDYYSPENEDQWIDMEPSPFVAIVEADSNESACKIAAKQKYFDARCLFATKI